jgi:hypothetical protein
MLPVWDPTAPPKKHTPAVAACPGMSNAGVTKLLIVKGGCVEMDSMLRSDVPVFVIVKFW